MRTSHIVLLVLTLWTLPAEAQLWSGILNPSRAIDWSNAGVSGGIPTRTTICQTLNPGATAAQINSAIANCPSGQVVMLNAGTYNLSAGISFNGKSNVTLRGSGPDSTFLIISGTVGCVYETLICVVSSSSINPQPPQNTANWTAGYSKGTTSITISNSSNLVVGSLLYLDQIDDNAASDPGLTGVWACTHGPGDGGAPYCTIEGDSSIDRPGRTQVQVVQVTSVSAGSCPCTVGISPGLYMPNWRSGQSPGAWWMGGGTTAVGIGIEDLSVQDSSGSGTNSSISFGNARDGWIKNVRSVNGSRSHVLLYGSLRITIRDSYFFGQKASSATSYGIETDISSSFLVENNIFHHLTSAMTMGQAAEGSVWGYNYAIDSYYCGNGCPSNWMQASSYHHTGGIAFTLFEGNDGTGFTADIIHGTTQFMTAFRNRWQGYDPQGGSSGGKTAQTIPVHIYANNRFFNIIGNVLGDDRRPHTNYEGFPTSATSPGANQDVSIYMLGYSGNQDPDPNVKNDLLVRSTLMRWGNYDTVTKGSRFVASEVPSGIGTFATAVPASQTLPSSFYLSSKPSWYGSVTWPSIGPDVVGVTGPGNHVVKIPARVCFESVMGGKGTEVSALTFSASKCYSAASGTALSAPTNLRNLQ